MTAPESLYGRRDRGEKDSPTKPVTSRMLARQPRKIEPSAFISASVYDRAFGVPPSMFRLRYSDIIRGLYAAEHPSFPLSQHSSRKNARLRSADVESLLPRSPFLPLRLGEKHFACDHVPLSRVTTIPPRLGIAEGKKTRRAHRIEDSPLMELYSWCSRWMERCR